jgi:phage terminase large subunit
MKIQATKIDRLYAPLYASPKRYFLLTGGRGSLKSSTVHDFITRLTMQEGQGVLFTRYSMVSAEKSIIPEFRLTCERLGLAQYFDFTKNIVTNKLTGSFIYFSGIKASSGDQTARLKSLSGITCWVIEEGEDFTDENTFNAIDDSIRATWAQNRVIWIMNPTDKEHFIHKRFIDGQSRIIKLLGYDVTVSAHPDVEHMHSTYHIAEEYLAESWLDKAERARQKAEERHKLWADTGGIEGTEKHQSFYYHNYIGGWREKAQGVIFEDWTEGAFDTSLPYAYGLDFGFYPDPTALVKVAVDNRQKVIYLDELWYQQRLSTDDINTGLRERCKVGLPIVADSAEPRLISEIRRVGLSVRPAQKGPDSVKLGIAAMSSYKLVVTPGSANLKRELNNYAWNDKKSSTPIDGYNHLIDAARYCFSFLTGIGSKRLPGMV